MNKKELLEFVNTLKTTFLENYDNGLKLYHKKLESLEIGKDDDKIVLIYDQVKSEILINSGKEDLYSFELARSLNNKKRLDEAEDVYNYLLSECLESSSILNNLSIIHEERGNIDLAFDLIEQAFKYQNHDNFNIIKTNRDRILGKVNRDQDLKNSVQQLQSLNDFELSKLTHFLEYIDKNNIWYDKKNYRIKLPQWQQKLAFLTSEDIASKLCKKWQEYNFITKSDKVTDPRGKQFNTYTINPYLHEGINKERKSRDNKIDIFEEKILKIIQLGSISVNSSDKDAYQKIIKAISKIKLKKYRDLISRDIDELFINYQLKNKKTVIIMSGSILETVFLYLCEEKKLANINYQDENGKQKSKKLYEANLIDLISFYEQSGNGNKIITYLAQISRVLRNFIHPAKEMKGTDILDATKMDICFASVKEIVLTLL